MISDDETVKRYREAKSAYDRITQRHMMIKEVLDDIAAKRMQCWRDLEIAAESLSDAGRAQMVEEQFGKR